MKLFLNYPGSALTRTTLGLEVANAFGVLSLLSLRRFVNQHVFPFRSAKQKSAQRAKTGAKHQAH